MASKLTERRFSVFWIVMALIAGLLIIGDLNRRMADARRLEQDAVILEEQVAAKSTEQADLMTRVAGATSEASIAEWAHADAKLVQEGEVLVVPLAPPDTTPAPEISDTEYPEQPTKFQVWWALLFGK
jgi:cell division protein FtsL